MTIHLIYGKIKQINSMEGGKDMFLTRKSFWKISIMAICYIVLGSACIAVGIAFTCFQTDATLLFVLGALLYLFCPLLILWGRYAEGKGILINLGNKLVGHELKPAEFIKRYEDLKSATDLVIKKPSMEILHLVAIAYDSLDDKENCLSAVDEMIAVASEKKKSFAKLIKTSILFSYGMTEEAEALFIEVQGTELNFLCQTLRDSLLKSDRAMAMGDYKTVEIYNLKLLAQTFPKLNNLSKLLLHFKLGEIYEKLQDKEKAIFYYQYCVNHGGETAIKEAAKNALERVS